VVLLFFTIFKISLSFLREILMPIYEYKCSKCGHAIEVMQKVSAPAPSPCANCQAADTMTRQVSLTSFHLKGGGWYSDLYGSSKKAETPANAETKADGASKGESTTAAPATTSPAAPSTGTAAAPATSGSGSGTGGGSSGGSTGSGP
jgi:putative FmdB family regulatory protein